jgi:hypothetical protein
MLDHFPDSNHIEVVNETENDLPPLQPLEKWVALLIGATGLIILAKTYFS